MDDSSEFDRAYNSFLINIQFMITMNQQTNPASLLFSSIFEHFWAFSCRGRPHRTFSLFIQPTDDTLFSITQTFSRIFT